jgi:hypothetical protein
MYDSDCQWVDEVNGMLLFSLEPGFCFIDDKCLMDGQVKDSDPCYYCNSTLASGDWSLDRSVESCVLHDIVPRNGIKVIAVATITSTVILTSLALIFCIMTCLKSGRLARNAAVVLSPDHIRIPESKATKSIKPLSFIMSHTIDEGDYGKASLK